MMVVISPLLAVIALLTVPLSTWMTAGDRAAVAGAVRRAVALHRRAERADRGGVHRARAGHGVRAARRGRGGVRGEERRAARRELPGAVRLGIIMPSMMFLGNLNYVAVAVVGAPARRVGRDDAWARCRRSSSTPGSSPSRSRRWRRWRTCCSPGWRRPSGCSSCSTRPSRCPSRRCLRVRARAPRPGGVRARVVPLPARTSPLIDDLSLVAEPGQTVAIVGPTGAGKTTLVNLVMRFYELDGGRITLDGVDIATMTRADLRSGIGMVLQDTWLFGGTIRENIAYGNPDATEEQLLAAAAGDLRRPVRPQPARRLRHPRRLRRRRGQRRGEAADHDRAGVPRRPVAADPGRGHQLGRHAHRGAGAAGDGRAAQRPHELRHRPPALHDPRRRPDPRDGRRAGSSSRARTTSCWPRSGAYHALYEAQFAAATL